MKLFFIEWTGKPLGLINVTKDLSRDHEILYWTGYNLSAEVNKSEFPNTVLHNQEDALSHVPAKEFESNEFAPPSEELLKQLSEDESIVLTMMNKKFGDLTLSQRKHKYYQYVAYWHGVLSQMKPDAIFYLVMPHSVYDYVIYALAKIMNIKIIMFDTALIHACLLPLTDYRKGSRFLEEELKRNEGKRFSIEDLSPDLRKYYEEQMEKRLDRAPLYLRAELKKHSGFYGSAFKLKIFLRSIKELNIIKRAFYFISNRLGDNLKKEYLSVQTQIGEGEKFVYVPLNYQPERTTSPQGGIFVDQILMIEALSAALPASWKIYVKEHPVQWIHQSIGFSEHRYRGYYRHIAKIPNVKLVPIETNSYSLIDNSETVATVTGTAGWEALLRSKPALVFGFPWYFQCHGVFNVRNADAAASALEKIVQGFKVDDAKILAYLVGLDKVRVKGYVDYYGQEISTISPEENTRNIVKALVTIL